jgi:hypothetical protein
LPCSEKTRSGVVSYVVNRSTGTGDRSQGSRDEEQSDEGADDVQEVEASGARASAKLILCLSERIDEDTSWTHTDETKPDIAKNKFKSEDMARVRQGKELLWTEVTKNDPSIRPSTNGCS